MTDFLDLYSQTAIMNTPVSPTGAPTPQPTPVDLLDLFAPQPTSVPIPGKGPEPGLSAEPTKRPPDLLDRLSATGVLPDHFGPPLAPPGADMLDNIPKSAVRNAYNGFMQGMSQLPVAVTRMADKDLGQDLRSYFQTEYPSDSTTGLVTGSLVGSTTPMALAALAPASASILTAIGSMAYYSVGAGGEALQEIDDYERMTGQELSSARKAGAALGYMTTSVVVNLAGLSAYRSLLRATAVPDLSELGQAMKMGDVDGAVKLMQDFVHKASRPVGKLVATDTAVGAGTAVSDQVLRNVIQMAYDEQQKFADNLLEAGAMGGTMGGMIGLLGSGKGAIFYNPIKALVPKDGDLPAGPHDFDLPAPLGPREVDTPRDPNDFWSRRAGEQVKMHKRTQPKEGTRPWELNPKFRSYQEYEQYVLNETTAALERLHGPRKATPHAKIIEDAVLVAADQRRLTKAWNKANRGQMVEPHEALALDYYMDKKLQLQAQSDLDRFRAGEATVDEISAGLMSLVRTVRNVRSSYGRALESLKIDPKKMDAVEVVSRLYTKATEGKWRGKGLLENALKALADESQSRDERLLEAFDQLERPPKKWYQADLDDARAFFFELMYNGMLSGKTIFKNFVSNPITNAVAIGERGAAGTVDSLLSGLTGREREMFANEVFPMLTGMVTGMHNGIKPADMWREWQAVRTDRAAGKPVSALEAFDRVRSAGGAAAQWQLGRRQLSLDDPIVETYLGRDVAEGSSLLLENSTNPVLAAAGKIMAIFPRDTLIGGDLLYRMGAAESELAAWASRLAQQSGLRRGTPEYDRFVGDFREHPMEHIGKQVWDAMGKPDQREVVRAVALDQGFEEGSLKFGQAIDDMLKNPPYAYLGSEQYQGIMERVMHDAGDRILMCDPPDIMQKIADIRKTDTPVVREFTRVLYPFYKFVANAMRASIEHTPGVGIVAAKREGRTNAEVLAKQILGASILTGLLLKFPDDSSLTGSPKNTEEARLWQSQGKQPNSVLIGDRWVSYQDYMEPLGTLFTEFVFFRDMLNRLDDPTKADTTDAFEQAANAAASFFLESSYLDRIGGSFGQFLKKQAKHTLSSLIPYSAGFVQMHRALQAAGKGEVDSPELETMWDYMANVLPGVDPEYPLRYDYFNQPVTRIVGDKPVTTIEKVGYFFWEWMGPTTSKVKPDFVSGELERLQVLPKVEFPYAQVTAEEQTLFHLPGTIELTREEQHKMADIRARFAKPLLASSIGEKGWTKVPDPMKIKLIDKILTNSSKKAWDVVRPEIMKRAREKYQVQPQPGPMPQAESLPMPTPRPVQLPNELFLTITK